MRKFNPDKELKRIQYGNRNKIYIVIIIFLLIISIGSTYALYQVRYSKRIIYTKVAPFSNKDINILAIYLDDKPTDKFPEKGSKVVFDKVVCDNGSTGVFNTNTWKLILEAEGKDKCSVYFRTTTDYIDDSGANPPELYQGLIPVTIDPNGAMKVADLTTNWYDYDDKRWANAVLVDNTNEEVKLAYFNEDGTLKNDIANKDIPMSYVLQMYVWIPRYKYQLFNVNNEGKSEQEIQIKFENGTLSTGEASCEISKTGVETCTNAENGKWYTHPAFTFGDTELSGIWVGKFETSGNETALTIKPDLTSLRNININSMFTASRNIEETYSTNFNLDSAQIDTHMMKNMEWGVVAYLTQSKYGRCTDGSCVEVTINSNAGYITGYASQAWNTTNGILASTTGNVYGIYDMNGSSWEYVMALVVTSDGEFNSNEAGFTTDPLEKYYDKYVSSTNDLDHTRGHLGDATRETLKTPLKEIGGWYGDYSVIPNNTVNWFPRSNTYARGSYSGIFAFTHNNGVSLINTSFRVVLTAQDGDE